jgi:hypothetical protein
MKRTTFKTNSNQTQRFAWHRNSPWHREDTIEAVLNYTEAERQRDEGRRPTHDLTFTSISHAARGQSCRYQDDRAGRALPVNSSKQASEKTDWISLLKSKCFWHQLEEYLRKRNCVPRKMKFLEARNLIFLSSIAHWLWDHSGKFCSKWCAFFMVNLTQEYGHGDMCCLFFLVWIGALINWSNPWFYRQRILKPKDVKPLPSGHSAKLQTQVCAIVNAMLFPPHHTLSLFFSIL